MKVKHFSGYGSVTATKIKCAAIGTNTKQLIIKVIGDHERGLYRNDYYDIYYWLVKRFAKDCTTYNNIYHINIQPGYERINDGYIETCTYTIDYLLK